MTATRALLVISFLALLLPGLGRLPFLDPDEGRYARTAQEMTERGDWVVPYFHDEPRLNKPVLFYWLEIASMRLLGMKEAAARLPSALAAAGTLLWLYLFARPRLGERCALAACGMLATMPLFFAMARAAVPDMTLTFFVFGATVSLYAGIVEPIRSPGHLIAGGICLGLGLLTKGPVALLVPLLAVSAGAAARRRAPITIAGRAVTSVWIMVLVAAPWAVLLVQRVGAARLLEILRRETLERYASGLDHPESAWFFLLTAPMTLFPWSAFVPFALYATVRARRRGDGLVPMLTAWLCGGFLFFSIGSAKLPSYVLPLAPAAALIIAMAMDLPDAGPVSARWAIWTLAALALAAVALPVRIGSELSRDAIVIPIFALLSGALALAGGLVSLWKDHHALAPSLAVAMGAVLLGLALVAPPRLADVRSTRTLVRDGALASLPGPVYVHRILRPSLSFYMDRTPVEIGRGTLLLRTLEAGSSASVVLEESRRRIVVGLLARGFRVVARSGGLLAMHRPAPAPGPA